MGKLCAGVYSGEAYNTYDKLTNGMRSYEVNTVYLNTVYNRLFFINVKGYVHVLEFKEVKGNKYHLHEFLLTTKNEEKHVGYATYTEEEYLDFCSKVVKI